MQVRRLTGCENVGPTGNVLLHIVPPQGTLSEELPLTLRRRCSAEYAIVLWSTPWRDSLRKCGTLVIGSPDDDGHQRACPLTIFFEGPDRLPSYLVFFATVATETPDTNELPT